MPDHNDNPFNEPWSIDIANRRVVLNGAGEMIGIFDDPLMAYHAAERVNFPAAHAAFVQMAQRSDDADRKPAELLTETEHDLVRQIGELLKPFADIAGVHRLNAEQDLAEVARHLHDLQNAVLANAAARAYPDKYRGLGAASLEHVMSVPSALSAIDHGSPADFMADWARFAETRFVEDQTPTLPVLADDLREVAAYAYACIQHPEGPVLPGFKVATALRHIRGQLDWLEDRLARDKPKEAS